MKQITHYENWTTDDLISLKSSFEYDSKIGSLSSFEEYELSMVILELSKRKGTNS